VNSPDSLSPAILDWLGQALGPQRPIQSVRLLNGSSSATLYKLQAGGASYVLRLFTNTEWLAEEPDVPLHEAANLARLRPAGLPVPELVALDADGAGCGLPALLMTCVPGAVQLTPTDMDAWLREMANFLPRLHAISPAGHPWRYAPYNDVSGLRVPEWSPRKDLWERAIAIINQAWPAFPTTFIHRDYHPMNVLFNGERLCGVVDWPNACVGPAGMDVAWNRLNLSAMYGVETADRFLRHCQEAMQAYWRYDPFWDLVALTDLLPDRPYVYPPWLDFGLAHLSDALMLERTEAYLSSLLARWKMNS
jgi:aminoglycoside phosphotransferase (APT) family kinase protein